jgi:dipeptidase E
VWKENKVDVMLRQAYKQGIVLSGLSAGAIFWFEYGSSDSPVFDNPDDKKLILLPALGIIPGLFSPHHIREPFRNEQLPEILKEVPDVTSYAADDLSALVIVDGKTWVESCDETRGVKKVMIKNGEIVSERI